MTEKRTERESAQGLAGDSAFSLPQPDCADFDTAMTIARAIMHKDRAILAALARS